MPLFFFHLQRSGTRLENFEGVRCPTAARAKLEALWIARDLMADDLKAGRALCLDDAVIVADATGDILETVSFSQAASAPVENAGILRKRGSSR